jgi:nucleotide-binding universal stress UspA family protein
MKILIAIDASEDASNALEFTLRFPFPKDSEMTVLTVVNDIPLLQAELDALNEQQSSALEEANRCLREEANDLLEQAANRLRNDNWPGNTMMRHGDPVNEILNVAAEIDADLVVVGSHGTGLAKRYLLGSVSDSMLEDAPCSVLIVRPVDQQPEQPAIKAGANAPFHITLAFDESDISYEALNLCSSLPLEDDSVITVINVMPLVTAYRQDVRQHINEIWQQKRQIMQAELDKAVRSLQWATPNVRAELREGESIADEVIMTAEETNSDMIMIGCKDKNSIKRFIYGSVTYRIARHASCSVWSVRHKQHRRG